MPSNNSLLSLHDLKGEPKKRRKKKRKEKEKKFAGPHLMEPSIIIERKKERKKEKKRKKKRKKKEHFLPSN